MAYTTINKSSEHFNTVLWEGNNTQGRQITGVGFEPDLVWLKNRTSSANHGLHTQITGVDGAEYLRTNGTNAITTSANHVPSFDSDGFTINNGLMLNDTSNNYVAWNWLGANASSSNTDGSITSTVSANTTSGFSIVSYTGNGTGGATVGHGIDTPKMMIIKNRDNTTGWGVYHADLGNTKYLQLNDTAAEGTTSTFWNNTTPTNQVFLIGTSGWMNNSGEDYIGYCFAEKQGYSKFGSYTGNGNADGTFVYTGFKPAFLIIKKTNATKNWFLHDDKRLGYNPSNSYVNPNLSSAEYAGTDLDIVSNGFKMRSTGGGHNESGHTYIYMAIGQSLVGSNNVPCTAR